MEKSEALYQMQEDIYPIIEEKVHITQGKEKIKRKEVVVLLILSFCLHIFSGISTPIFSKDGFKVLNLTHSYSLMC